MHSQRPAKQEFWKQLGSGKPALWLLTTAYVVLGLFYIRSGYAINNEGLLSHLNSKLLAAEFWPVFFYQKAKPVLSLLYLPASQINEQATMTQHLLLSALGLPMIAAVARKLGLERPNLAAFILALSPIFLVGGAAALSNLDGIVGCILFLYLALIPRRYFAAGLVLGMLPWVRHELALFSAIFFVWGVVERKGWGFILGLMAFPLIYGLMGAVYHGDLLWLIRLAPTTLQSMPGLPDWLEPNPEALIHALLSLSPAIFLGFSFRYASLSRIEKYLLLYLASWLLLSTVLPIFHIGNFAFAPRYLALVLPILVLFSLRAINAWSSRDFALFPAFAPLILLLFLFVSDGLHEPQISFPVLFLGAATLLLALAGKQSLAVAAAVLLVAIGPLLNLRVQVSSKEFAPHLPEVSQWLRENVPYEKSLPPGERSPPVYTNQSELSTYLDGPGKLPGLDLRYMIGVDQYFDLMRLNNDENGQRAGISRAIRGWFYGSQGVPPQELTPENLPPGTLLVLRRDRRLPLQLAPEIWEARLETLLQGERFWIARVRDPSSEQTQNGAQEGEAGKAPIWNLAQLLVKDGPPSHEEEGEQNRGAFSSKP